MKDKKQGRIHGSISRGWVGRSKKISKNYCQTNPQTEKWLRVVCVQLANVEQGTQNGPAFQSGDLLGQILKNDDLCTNPA